MDPCGSGADLPASCLYMVGPALCGVGGGAPASCQRPDCARLSEVPEACSTVPWLQGGHASQDAQQPPARQPLAAAGCHPQSDSVLSTALLSLKQPAACCLRPHAAAWVGRKLRSSPQSQPNLLLPARAASCLAGRAHDRGGRGRTVSRPRRVHEFVAMGPQAGLRLA
jgi:hypothetical protein